MREIQASEAKTRFFTLLDDVERGATIVITRHGKAIARLIPERDHHKVELDRLFEDILAFREKMPHLSLEEMESARREGQKS
jgi:prevent-host-death family protein